MKRLFVLAAALLLLLLLLCACTDVPEEESGGASVLSVNSAETEQSCVHEFGDEPVQTVGNLDIYECSLCGEQSVVANGTLIGGE